MRSRILAIRGWSLILLKKSRTSLILLLNERQSINVLRYFQAIDRRPDITEGLKRLKCRTLVFVGDSSPFHSESVHMTAKLDRRYSALVESVPMQAGQTPPLLQYFRTLLTKGKLNAFESLKLSRLVVNQNKKNILENWLVEGKLECSEELGDLVKTVDNDLALKIYIKARATPKVVAVFLLNEGNLTKFSYTPSRLDIHLIICFFCKQLFDQILRELLILHS